MNDLTKTYNLIDCFKNYNKKNDDPISNVAKLAFEFLDNKKKNYNTYDIQNTNKFCIFESFSNKYYLENFHSDILKLILSPQTKEIGDMKAFELFLAYLGIPEENINDVEVTREKFIGIKDKYDKQGYIDLLICYKVGKLQKAIIIENKINGAPDMPNQLARYMEYVENNITKDYKVIYLTLVDAPPEKPDIDAYLKKYDGYKNKLKAENGEFKKAAVSSCNSLVEGFLKKYLEEIETKLNGLLKNNHISKTTDIFNNAEISRLLKSRDFIKHYITLLEHLAGDVFMAGEEREFIKKIYEELNLEAFEAVKNLVKVWNKKNNGLHELIEKGIQDLLEKKKLKAIPDTHDDGYVIYKIDPGNKKNYFVYFDRRAGENDFGIIPKNIRFKVDEQETYKEKFRDLKFKSTGKIISNEKWVYCNVDVDSKDVIKDTVENIEKLLNINLE